MVNNIFLKILGVLQANLCYTPVHLFSRILDKVNSIIYLYFCNMLIYTYKSMYNIFFIYLISIIDKMY